jgi:hypothetical protein
MHARDVDIPSGDVGEDMQRAATYSIGTSERQPCCSGSAMKLSQIKELGFMCERGKNFHATSTFANLRFRLDYLYSDGNARVGIKVLSCSLSYKV